MHTHLMMAPMFSALPEAGTQSMCLAEKELGDSAWMPWLQSRALKGRGCWQNLLELPAWEKEAGSKALFSRSTINATAGSAQPPSHSSIPGYHTIRTWIFSAPLRGPRHTPAATRLPGGLGTPMLSESHGLLHLVPSHPHPSLQEPLSSVGPAPQPWPPQRCP